MERNECRDELICFIKNKKTKTFATAEIYSNLKIPYTPKHTNMLNECLAELAEQGIIEPIKSTVKDNKGNYSKYKIKQNKNEDLEIIKQEILNTLVKKIDIGYYLKNPNEYIKNKDFINKINEFLKNPDATLLTVNERSYTLFKDEKKLKQNEDILHKLGLFYSDIFAYDTYEPFFCYINPQYKKTEKEILIIENKDTFWTMKKLAENSLNIYMVIYGEGKKILKSFPYIENFDISKTDNIQYFGDIDYEGINIYYSLKEKYSEYNINLYKTGYEKILDNETEPANIKTKQNKNTTYIQNFINEFDNKYKEELIYIFNNERYIPQEVLNYQIAMG